VQVHEDSVSKFLRSLLKEKAVGKKKFSSRSSALPYDSSARELAAATGTGFSDDTVLAMADEVLGPYWETVFRAFLRRLQGVMKKSLFETPKELVPYLQFKPPQAVLAPQVRSALRLLLSMHPELVEATGALYKGPLPKLHHVVEAIGRNDRKTLSVQACAAAAVRSDGWTVIVATAAAGWAGLHQGWAMAQEAAEKQETQSEKREERVVVRLEERIAALEKRLTDKDHDLERLRGANRVFDTECGHLKKVEEESRVRFQTAETRLKQVGTDLEKAMQELLQVERSKSEVLRERTRREQELAHQMDVLRAEKAPDLEPFVHLLEWTASHFREVTRPFRKEESLAVPESHGAGDELFLQAKRVFESGGEDANTEKSAKDWDAERPAPRDDKRSSRKTSGSGETKGKARSHNGVPRRGRSRSSVSLLPKGLMPGSTAAVDWALSEEKLSIVVDGYNVTRQVERGWGVLPGQEQRQLLISRCWQARRHGGADILVVFDAEKPDYFVGRRSIRGVRYEFSGGPTADDRIVEIVARMPESELAMVVTSDKGLGQRLADLNVALVSSEVFLEAVGAPMRNSS